MPMKTKAYRLTGAQCHNDTKINCLDLFYNVWSIAVLSMRIRM